MFISSINKGGKNLITIQNQSQLSNKYFKQSGKKSAQEQYDDLFKTLGGNYFQKTAVGYLINKKNIKNITLIPNSVRQMNSQFSNKNYSNNFQIVEQFNQMKQINKLLKIGDIFGNNQLKKNTIKSINFLSQENKYEKNKSNHIIYEQKQTLNQSKSNKFTRPTTTATKRKFQRYISAQNKKSMIDFKFVRIQTKLSTKNINRLKKSVDQLQNLAITKYGIQFKNYENRQTSKNNENINLKIQQMAKRLRQIRNSRPEEEKNQPQDCSIPSHFMKILSSRKKNALSVCNLSKKSHHGIYLRV